MPTEIANGREKENMMASEGEKVSFSMGSSKGGDRKRRRPNLQSIVSADESGNSAAADSVVEMTRDGRILKEGEDKGPKKPLIIPLPEADLKRRDFLLADVERRKKQKTMMAKIAHGEVDLDSEQLDKEAEKRSADAQRILAEMNSSNGKGETSGMDVQNVPLLMRRQFRGQLKAKDSGDWLADFEKEDEDEGSTIDRMDIDTGADGMEDNADLDKEKFLSDVYSRPDSATMDDYDRVPIEAFGEAMLRGMGWAPGKAVGLNNKGVAAPIEFRPRHHRLGLGANQSALDELERKRAGEERSAKPDPRNLVGRTKDGKTRHHRTLDEDLVEYTDAACPFRCNDLVTIVGGTHEGMFAKVLDVIRVEDEEFDFMKEDTPKKQFRPRLQVQFPSLETATVKVADVSRLDELKLHADHPALNLLDDRSRRDLEKKRKRYGSSENDQDGQSSRKRRKESGSSSRGGRENSRSSKSASRKPSGPSWVVPHISVRIVSQRFEGGKYYCKRVVVEDVVSPTECIVRLEGGTKYGLFPGSCPPVSASSISVFLSSDDFRSCRLVEGVQHRHVETALPRPGGIVLVVKGKHRGTTGKLLERNAKKDQVTLQTSSDLEIITCSFEEVAQYHGRME